MFYIRSATSVKCWPKKYMSGPHNILIVKQNISAVANITQAWLIRIINEWLKVILRYKVII